MWFEARTEKSSSISQQHCPAACSELLRPPGVSANPCVLTHGRAPSLAPLERVCVPEAWLGWAACPGDRRLGSCWSLSPAPEFPRPGRPPSFLSSPCTPCPAGYSFPAPLPAALLRPGSVPQPGPWRCRRCRAPGWPSARSCLTSPRS